MIIYSTCFAFPLNKTNFMCFQYSIHACISEWSGVLTKIDRMKNSLTLHNHEKGKNGKKWNTKKSVRFKVSWSDFTHSFPSSVALPCRKTETRRKKKKNLAGTKESTCSHLKQDNQMKHIIRFEYHEKIIFNIIANKITTKAEKKSSWKRIIFYEPRHTARSIRKEKKRKLFFLHLFLFRLSRFIIKQMPETRAELCINHISMLQLHPRRFSFFFSSFSFIKH